MTSTEQTAREPLGWAVVELMGHRRLAGYVSEQEVAGAAMLRLDIPGPDGQPGITHGAHIVGAVPNFDTEVLGQLLREHRLTPAWHYHLIDVEALAVGYLAMQGKLGIEQSVLTPEHLQRIQPPWSSDDLTKAIGVQPATEEERHTALGDARWAMRMYDAITGGQA